MMPVLASARWTGKRCLVQLKRPPPPPPPTHTHTQILTKKRQSRGALAHLGGDDLQISRRGADTSVARPSRHYAQRAVTIDDVTRLERSTFANWSGKLRRSVGSPNSHRRATAEVTAQPMLGVRARRDDGETRKNGKAPSRANSRSRSPERPQPQRLPLLR